MTSHFVANAMNPRDSASVRPRVVAGVSRTGRCPNK
jgi:hypothetical protein